MPIKFALGDPVDYEDSNGSIHRLFVYGILLDGKYLLSRSAWVAVWVVDLVPWVFPVD